MKLSFIAAACEIEVVDEAASGHGCFAHHSHFFAKGNDAMIFS